MTESEIGRIKIVVEFKSGNGCEFSIENPLWSKLELEENKDDVAMLTEQQIGRMVQHPPVQLLNILVGIGMHTKFGYTDMSDDPFWQIIKGMEGEGQGDAG